MEMTDPSDKRSSLLQKLHLETFTMQVQDCNLTMWGHNVNLASKYYTKMNITYSDKCTSLL
jgi:hypothetical protein